MRSCDSVYNAGCFLKYDMRCAVFWLRLLSVTFAWRALKSLKQNLMFLKPLSSPNTLFSYLQRQLWQVGRRWFPCQGEGDALFCVACIWWGSREPPRAPHSPACAFHTAPSSSQQPSTGLSFSSAGTLFSVFCFLYPIVGHHTKSWSNTGLVGNVWDQHIKKGCKILLYAAAEFSRACAWLEQDIPGPQCDVHSSVYNDGSWRQSSGLE